MEFDTTVKEPQQILIYSKSYLRVFSLLLLMVSVSMCSINKNPIIGDCRARLFTATEKPTSCRPIHDRIDEIQVGRGEILTCSRTWKSAIHSSSTFSRAILSGGRHPKNRRFQ